MAVGRVRQTKAKRRGDVAHSRRVRRRHAIEMQVKPAPQLEADGGERRPLLMSALSHHNALQEPPRAAYSRL